MATLTVAKIVEAGVSPSLVAAASGGDKFKNPDDQRIFLHAKNTNAATRTITATAQRTSKKVKDFGSLTRGNIAVTVPATTGDVMIGPFSSAFNDASGFVLLTYDAVAGLTVVPVSLDRVDA